MTVLGHAEFGETYTRGDGGFDIAVNGGGLITIEFSYPGYLRAQRQATVRWRDFAVIKDLVLVPFDSQVTEVDLTSSAAIQVARGSTESDDDGTRRATVLFPQGTQATLVLADGSTQSISTLSVRATEFTVGDSGPSAMPASLPPTSSYTYAVELSADEAEDAGATEVRFNNAIPFYVENFLSFPVGMKMPVGYYDREEGIWVPSKDGRVVKILAEDGGFAEMDTDGNGTADSPAVLAALGVTDDERGKLAELYAPGDTLWRVALTHFTPYDCNLASGFPASATSPSAEPPTGDDPNECSPTATGSIIKCDRQILGEELPIRGTPYSLNYSSDRTAGRAASRTLTIPLSGSMVPPSLERIDLAVTVAGRTFKSSHPAAPNQITTFAWDGVDAYGRVLQGRHPVTVEITYVYIGVYQLPGGAEATFAQLSGVPLENPAREERYLSSTWMGFLGTLDALGLGLGGWTIDVHHAYEPTSRRLYLGDGSERDAALIGNEIRTIAGGGSVSSAPDGTPATDAFLDFTKDVKVRSDGTIFFSTSGSFGGFLYRIDEDGRLYSAYPVSKGRPFAFGPDDSLYIAEDFRVFRIEANGAKTPVAGSGQQCGNLFPPPEYPNCGDGGPALAAGFAAITAIDFGPDGALYVMQAGDNRIRRITLGGNVSAFAGKHGGSTADGIPAVDAAIEAGDIDIARDGSIYIPQSTRVRRISPDGFIRTVAGTGDVPITVELGGSPGRGLSDFAVRFHS